MSSFSLDESLGFLINRTARRLKQELQHAFKTAGYDITPEQWAILNRLWAQEGLSQVELADLTFKDKPNVTRMLDVLERRQLIVRREDEHDRRVFQVYLTDEGRGLQTRLIPLARAVLDRGQQGLTATDIEDLKRKLAIIYENFE